MQREMDRWNKVLGKVVKDEIKDTDERARLEKGKELFL